MRSRPPRFGVAACAVCRAPGIDATAPIAAMRSMNCRRVMFLSTSSRSRSFWDGMFSPPYVLTGVRGNRIVPPPPVAARVNSRRSNRPRTVAHCLRVSPRGFEHAASPRTCSARPRRLGDRWCFRHGPGLRVGARGARCTRRGRIPDRGGRGQGGHEAEGARGFRRGPRQHSRGDRVTRRTGARAAAGRVQWRFGGGLLRGRAERLRPDRHPGERGRHVWGVDDGQPPGCTLASRDRHQPQWSLPHDQGLSAGNDRARLGTHREHCLHRGQRRGRRSRRLLCVEVWSARAHALCCTRRGAARDHLQCDQSRAGSRRR